MKSNIRISILLLLLISASINLLAQKPAYKLFNAKGKEVKYEKMMKVSSTADVVLFGEQHNDPIAHWLQYELTKDLHKKRGKDLILGAEMFETDNQLIIDEYLAGLMKSDKFEQGIRLWSNYKTDYKPLVEFAKDSGLRFIATNVPRRYANMTYKLGLDTLLSISEKAKEFLPPLPLVYDTTLSCYSSLAGGGGPMGHGSPNFRDSQAIKDATMSHFILKNLNEGATFLHYNGAYHSDNFESMYYFLKEAMPEIRIVTISTIHQPDVSTLDKENYGLADYIICIDEDMTRTYEAKKF